MPFPGPINIENSDCSICLESIQPLAEAHKTSCSHYFHKTCAVKAFNASIIATEKALCPMCREDQKLEEIQEAVDRLIVWMGEEVNKGNSIGLGHKLAEARIGEYVNLLSSHKWSLLSQAVRQQDVDFIRLLVAAGANSSMRAAYAENNILSPLMMSFYSENPDVFHETLKGFDPLEVNTSPDNSFAIFDLFISQLSKIKIDRIMIAKELISMGADVNSNKLVGGNTPLHIAAQSPYNKIVQFLLDHGAQIDTRNASGRSALEYAILANRVHNVWTLLDHKASTDSSISYTLKQLATAKGFTQIAKALPNEYSYLATNEMAQQLINEPRKLIAVDKVIEELTLHYQDPEAEFINITDRVIESEDPKCPALFLAIMANKVDRVWKLLIDFCASAHAPFCFEQGDVKMYLTAAELAEILGRKYLLQSSYLAESVREYEDHYKAPSKPFFHEEAPI